jgi:uncharacterized protein
MDLDKIKQLAEQLMLNTYGHVERGLGDHYYHGQRVAKLSVTLRKMILPDDDSHDEILTVAGWFHDIAKGKPQHDRFGAVIAREALRNYCTPEQLDEIVHIISLHSDRGHPEYSDWIQLQQDADLLDHFGTYNVWMTLAYCAYKHDSNLVEIANHDVEEFVQQKSHWQEESCNYEVSRRIIAEKLNYWYNFMKRMKVEANGEFWVIPE